MEVYDLWEAEDNRKEKWLQSRPICCICKEHIQEEMAIYYNDQWCHKDSFCSNDFWNDGMEDFLEDVEELS